MMFRSGQIVATPAALALLGDLGLHPLPFLLRHLQGDWGQLSQEDVQANADALAYGGRVLSSYELVEGRGEAGKPVRLWIITEADRSYTTLLLPEDY